MHSTKPYKPKLFVVLSRFPYPIDKGDKLRAYYQLRDLSEEWDIYLHCLTQQSISKEQRAAIAPFCKELHVHQLNFLLILWNCAWQLIGNKPFQVAYFYQRSIYQKINHSLENVKPQHIFCQLLRTAEYVKNYHACSKTIDYMDALSEGIKRRIPTANFAMRLVLKSEWKRLLRYENVIFDYFENHLIISRQDQQLMAHPQRNKIKIIPNGVGEHFLASIPAQDRLYDFVFVGNLSYPPNIETARFICEELLPYAIQKGKNWRVLIAGAQPSKQIYSYQSKNIHVAGWAEDVRTHYLSGKVFVAPMFMGTGLQNKLLEAMALGLPCITTPLAKNALQNAENEVLTADSAATFYELISQLIDQQPFYINQSLQGKKYVQTHYDWKSIHRELSSLLHAQCTNENA